MKVAIISDIHASPRSYDDLTFAHTPHEEVMRLRGPDLPVLLAGGHTHLQQPRRLGATCFVNPGTAGAAYNRQPDERGACLAPWAEYAVLASAVGWLGVEFRRVSLDLTALLAAIVASGRPGAAARAAEYG